MTPVGSLCLQLGTSGLVHCLVQKLHGLSQSLRSHVIIFALLSNVSFLDAEVVSRLSVA